MPDKITFGATHYDIQINLLEKSMLIASQKGIKMDNENYIEELKKIYNQLKEFAY